MQSQGEACFMGRSLFRTYDDGNEARSEKVYLDQIMIHFLQFNHLVEPQGSKISISLVL